jgi:hypothetical protein
MNKVISFIISVLFPFLLFGQSFLDSNSTAIIKNTLKEGTLAYNNERFSDALGLFRTAFNSCPPPYNTPLKLNVAKNYIGVLGLGKEYSSFERVSKRVLQDLEQLDCDEAILKYKIDILVNINGAATYRGDSSLCANTYNQIVKTVTSCGLDSIDLAQGALNLANLYLAKDHLDEVYPLLEIGRKYRGKHYAMYDAELSFLEARVLFYDHQFFKSRDLLLQSAEEFKQSNSLRQALNPINWGIRRLTPFLDSNSIATLVKKNFEISDSLGISDNNAELKLVESLVKVNALQDQLLLADKRKSTLLTIVSLLSVMLAFGMSLFLLKRQSLTIKTLGSSIVRYRKSSLNSADVNAIIEHCRKFGEQLENGVHGKTENLDADMVEHLYAQFFPHVYKSILVSQPNWTVGERQLFISLMLGVKASVGAEFLKTSLNSYRVRKSKLIKKLPESFKQDPRQLIANMPNTEDTP